MCLLSISEVSNGLRNPLIGRQRRRYLLSRPRWANTVSEERWTLSTAILVVAILPCGNPVYDCGHNWIWFNGLRYFSTWFMEDWVWLN
jgi:hypothetical protein